ncbi:MAG TPA: hypothetical protein VIL85_12680 [Thermomicrobiales bacterium]|jgi:hypothetical protein
MTTYAEAPRLVTLPKSVATHSATELAYAGCDETTGIVHFTAPSSHKPGTLNTVSLDTYTGHIFCDCTGAMTNHLCWHCCYVTAAWQAHPAVAEARVLIGSRLISFGKKHARLVATYRQRIGRAGDYDAVRLLAARWEYRQRQAIAATPLAA